QAAAVPKGDGLAGGQDRPVGGGLSDLTHLREKGDGLLQAKPLGLIPIFDRQHRHRNPSQRTQVPPQTLLPGRPSKIERDTPASPAVPLSQPTYSSPVEAAPPPAQPLAPAQPAAWAADAADPQLQALSSPNDHARAEAAVQLGRIKATRAVQPLTQLLSADRS